MAIMYVAWHKYNRAFIAGFPMAIEGQFLASETIDISAGGTTGVAPGGAEYATVWADAAFEFATGATPAAAKGNASKALPASEPVQVSGIIPGTTKIAGIAI